MAIEMAKNLEINQSAPRIRGKINRMMASGMLQGEILSSPKRKLELEIWIGEIMVASDSIITYPEDKARQRYSANFEILIDTNAMPTEWLITQELPIILRVKGKKRPINPIKWRPGRRDSDELRSIGLKTIASQGRAEDLISLAMKPGDESLLRNCFIEALGYSLDRYIGCQDSGVEAFAYAMLRCSTQLSGINRLVLQRSAYLAIIFCRLTACGDMPASISTLIENGALSLNAETVIDCFTESMSTPHLDCERNLWNLRINLFANSLSYKLCSNFLVPWPISTSKLEVICHTKDLDMLRRIIFLMSQYVLECLSQSDEALLLYQLCERILGNRRANAKFSLESTRAHLLKQLAIRKYHDALVCAVDYCQNIDKTFLDLTHDDSELALALVELSMVFSGSDFSNRFESFFNSTLLAIDLAWSNPFGSKLRSRIDRELLAFCSRYRSIAQKILDSGFEVSRAVGFEEDILEKFDILVKKNSPAPKAIPSRPVKSPRRWLIIGNRGLTQCWIYRALQKRDFLISLGHQVRIVCYQHGAKQISLTRHLLWADVIIVCRLPYTYSVAKLYVFARTIGRPVLYEIDDLIFARQYFPPPYESYGGTISLSEYGQLFLGNPLFRKSLVESDGCIVSTSCLGDYIVSEGICQESRVFTLTNLMLPPLWKSFNSHDIHNMIRPGFGRPLRIVFTSGTLAHKYAWTRELAPALAELMQRYQRLELLLLGRIETPGCLLPFIDRIHWVAFQDYATYIQSMSTAHIGVSIVEENAVTDCKSLIKWMEFSCCRLASIISPTETAKRELKPGVNVLFARGTQEWISKIEYLILNNSARVRLAQKACSHAIESFDKSAGLQEYQDFVNKVSEQFCSSDLTVETASQQKVIKKILIINVFFRPDSHGGATRIAEQQSLAASVQDAKDHQYEVTVLCQEQSHSASQPIEFLVHYVKNVRVIRACLPGLRWGEYWSNKTSLPLTRILEDWYRKENFDLIHAHCLQGLTIAPLIAAVNCNIPYIISLHDAWWLSPYLFLTTEDGTCIDPLDPLAHLSPRESRTVKSRAARRRDELFALLERADRRLAVSAVFSDIYVKSGVRNVEVLANRVHATEVIGRRISCLDPGRRIRACFVGGISAHKGYFVLRDALLSLDDIEMDLDIVDHRMKSSAASIRALKWGSSRIRLIPKVPMSMMNDFYSNYDLLIAPSIWPESFGLVTREAISAGLWVVASNTGALAEEIIDGVNGLRSKPKDVEDLIKCIRQSVTKLQLGLEVLRTVDVQDTYPPEIVVDSSAQRKKDSNEDSYTYYTDFLCRHFGLLK